MLVTSAVVMLAVGLYGQQAFRVPAGERETRSSLVFWLLLLGVWSGLNTVVLGQDLFTLFVALELLTFSAVPLVALSGQPETLAAALRYLLFALLGLGPLSTGCGAFLRHLRHAGHRSAS